MWSFLVELTFDVVNPVLAATKQDNSAWLETGKLSTKLRANRSASSCYQNRFAVYDFLNRTKVKIRWFAPEQVVVRNFPDRKLIGSAKMIFERRQDLDLESEIRR